MRLTGRIGDRKLYRRCPSLPLQSAELCYLVFDLFGNACGICIHNNVLDILLSRLDIIICRGSIPEGIFGKYVYILRIKRGITQ